MSVKNAQEETEQETIAKGFFWTMFLWFASPIFISAVLVSLNLPESYAHLLRDGNLWLAFALLIYYPAVLAEKAVASVSYPNDAKRCDFLSRCAVIAVYFFAGLLPLHQILKLLLPESILTILTPNMVLAYVGLVIVVVLALIIRAVLAPTIKWYVALGINEVIKFDLSSPLKTEESKTLIAFNYIILGSFGAFISGLATASVVAFTHIIGITLFVLLGWYYNLDHPGRPSVWEQFKSGGKLIGSKTNKYIRGRDWLT